MGMNKFGMVLAAALSLSGAALAGGSSAGVATASIVNVDGQVVGTAQFVQRGHTLEMQVTARGLTPGLHGMHIHEKGLCAEGPDKEGKIVAFGAAGSHFDPGQSGRHNTPYVSNSMGHGGDLPMLNVGADGIGRVSFSTQRLSLYGKTSVLDRSLVIHSGQDDFKSQPAGNSGARVACGAIELQ